MLKIWTIAWKDIYTKFTDRNLIWIMLATPLALATIVGLAFGGLGGGDVPIQDIPIAILNADQGMAQGFNFGQVYLDLLTPAEGQDGQGAALPGCNLPSGETAGADQSEPGAGVSLLDLTDAVAFDDALARQLRLIRSGKPHRERSGGERRGRRVRPRRWRARPLTRASIPPRCSSRRISRIA